MSRRLSVDECVAALNEGRVVALPTDTVYGLAARWDLPHAVEEIFELKRRPRDVALPVLVASTDQITATGAPWPDPARRLATHFWPGALTIATPVPPELARRIGALDSVGWRQPGAPLTLEVLQRTGPLAVTSANRHGQDPGRSADEVLRIFTETPLAGVLDGGDCQGEVSTVMELRESSWWVRRRGGVASEAITEILGTPPEPSADR